MLEFPGCPGDDSPDRCWSWTTQDKKQVDCRFKAAGSNPAAYIFAHIARIFVPCKEKTK